MGWGPKIKLPKIKIKPPKITIPGMPCIKLPNLPRHRLPDWQNPMDPWLDTHVGGAMSDAAREIERQKQQMLEDARSHIGSLYKQLKEIGPGHPAYDKIKAELERIRGDLPPDIADIIDDIFPPDSEPAPPTEPTPPAQPGKRRSGPCPSDQ